MPRSTGLENRYHVRIFDEQGNALDLNNLTRDDLSEFEASHETDDLDYTITHGHRRPTNVSVPRVA